MNKFLVIPLCALILCVCSSGCDCARSERCLEIQLDSLRRADLQRGCSPRSESRCEALGLPGSKVAKRIIQRVRKAPQSNFVAKRSTMELVSVLPQDADGWHVSVVGSNSDATYRRLLLWFSTDAELMDLKKQVHFQSIESGTDTYKTRFAPNIAGLPTVRVQDGSKIVYEVSGGDTPATADELYAAIASASRPLLPWRKKIENLCKPKLALVPVPPIDIKIGIPVIDGPPKFVARKVLKAGSVVGLALLSLVAGCALGLVSWWRRTYPKQ